MIVQCRKNQFNVVMSPKFISCKLNSNTEHETCVIIAKKRQLFLHFTFYILKYENKKLKPCIK